MGNVKQFCQLQFLTKRNIVVLIKVNLMALLRKVMSSMATESGKIGEFLDFGYHANEKE